MDYRKHLKVMSTAIRKRQLDIYTLFKKKLMIH